MLCACSYFVTEHRRITRSLPAAPRHECCLMRWRHCSGPEHLRCRAPPLGRDKVSKELLFLLEQLSTAPPSTPHPQPPNHHAACPLPPQDSRRQGCRRGCRPRGWCHTRLCSQTVLTPTPTPMSPKRGGRQQSHHTNCEQERHVQG